jgi:hypothetical protein
MQVDGCAGEESVCGPDQRAGRRNVEHLRLMTGSHTCDDDAVVVGGAAACDVASFGWCPVTVVRDIVPRRGIPSRGSAHRLRVPNTRALRARRSGRREGD